MNSKRSMPGRIIGVSKDAAGNTALRMAMQTREQHIRREKANSNICTSQVLLANIASLYAVFHGPAGLKRIAGRIHRLTDILADGLQKKGLKLRHAHYFDTLCVEVADKAAVLARAEALQINLRSDIHGAVGITLDEATTREDVLNLFRAIVGDDHGLDIDTLDKDVALDSRSIPAAMLRDDAILTHPVFNRYHSETEMMRYMHALERKDLALNQAMIPLGSCTMKLNAAAEMIPITWPEFAELHPFCPVEQAEGYHQMIAQLSDWLVKLTGYDAVCMQPNSGAQGEYAGLLAIRHYHESRNEGHRDICLIQAPRTAPTRLPRRWRVCRSWSLPATKTATSILPTCVKKQSRQGRISPASWSPIRQPTACMKRPSVKCARSCTSSAARFISMAPT
ncbi:glycine dehydrogenase [Klebsiella aerogenes]|nr:glycine dehydrogenase [Klebsiella aerogenes]